MHKIGIISDTHGLLRPEVIHALQDCEVILHGGDFDKEKILKTLERIAPVYAVRGNNDDWAVSDENFPSHRQSCALPETLTIELYGVKIFMTHNKKMIPKETGVFDVVIYGHSHIYEEKYVGRQLLLNPGSCGPKRFTLPITLAIMEIGENGSYHVTKIELEKSRGSAEAKKALRSFDQKGKHSLDMKSVIELVIKDTDKKIPVDRIADKRGIDRKLAEQICRLYLTHPGVDAEGIMRKMGL